MSPTPHQYIQKLQLVHLAQLFALVVVNVLAYFFHSTGSLVIESNYWLYILAIFLAVTGTVSMMVFRMLVRKAQEQAGLQGKLNSYTVAAIARLALIEVSGLFAAVVVMVTGNLQAYVVSVIAILMLLMHRPRIAVLIEDLDLSGEERAQVESR